MMKFISYFFVFFCLFPYIQIIPLSTDNQPNALCLGFIIINYYLIKYKKIPVQFLLLFVLVFISLFIFLFSDLSFSSARSLMNYISLGIIPFSAYVVLKIYKPDLSSILKWTIYIYFLVGLIQTLVYPNFMAFVLPRGNSLLTISTGRGVVGLAPEPTFYGFMCLLLLILVFIYKSNYPIHTFKILTLLLISQVFVFSRSSASILVLALSLFSYYAYKMFKQSIISSTIGLLFIIVIGIGFYFTILPDLIVSLQEYRIGQILSLLYNDPFGFVFADASMNERFNSVYFSFLGFFENFGIPNGFDSYGDYFISKKYNFSYKDYFMDYMYYEGKPTRIMSGIGSVLYELGVFGIIPIYFIIKNFIKCKQRKEVYVWLLILFMFISINALTFTNALLCFIIGVIYYLSLENGSYKQ